MNEEDFPEARRRAHLRAFELVWEVQASSREPAAEVEHLLAHARAQDWPEVVLGCLFVRVMHTWWVEDPALVDAVAELKAAAEEHGDDAMVAGALAAEAFALHVAAAGTSALDADRSLAAAVVILESSDSAALERVNAHLNCALALNERRMWELQEQQYAAADKLLSECGLPTIAAVVHFNRAELRLLWVLGERTVDPEAAVRRLPRVLEGIAEALTVDMQQEWRLELRAMRALALALAGAPVAQEVAQLAELYRGDRYVGYLHLALSLAEDEVGPRRARQGVLDALATIDPRVMPAEYELALCRAAELEAGRRPGSAAGLVYGTHLARTRWVERSSALDVMAARLQAERQRAENDQLRRQAHLDALTGLANRRGLERYVEALGRRGVEAVAVLVVDVDRFKDINDRFGHSVGDEALVHVAEALAASVRAEDLACRLGGDEFVVVLAEPGLPVAHDRGRVILSRLAERPWSQRRADLVVSVSIGIAAGPVACWERVVASADSALYRAKSAGGGRVHADEAADRAGDRAGDRAADRTGDRAGDRVADRVPHPSPHGG